MRLKTREQGRNIASNTCKIRAVFENGKSVEETAGRFWEKVRKGDGAECWEWQGSVGANGYGTFRLPHPSRDVVGSHRMAYFLANGEIPTGLLIRHKCDNRRCVNPNHLETGTKKDNARDMVERGRMVKRDQSGENNGAAKLTSEQVAIIRDLTARGLRNTDIAIRFGVSHGTVSNIRRGVSWA